MGATLADGGVNPVTGQQVVSAGVCRDTLAILAANGAYERSGEWLFEIGLPGKSGVAGGLVTIAPARPASAPFPHPWTPPETACAANAPPRTCHGCWGSTSLPPTRTPWPPTGRISCDHGADTGNRSPSVVAADGGSVPGANADVFQRCRAPGVDRRDGRGFRCAADRGQHRYRHLRLGGRSSGHGGRQDRPTRRLDRGVQGCGRRVRRFCTDDGPFPVSGLGDRRTSRGRRIGGHHRALACSVDRRQLPWRTTSNRGRLAGLGTRVVRRCTSRSCRAAPRSTPRWRCFRST